MKKTKQPPWQWIADIIYVMASRNEDSIIDKAAKQIYQEISRKKKLKR